MPHVELHSAHSAGRSVSVVWTPAAGRVKVKAAHTFWQTLQHYAMEKSLHLTSYGGHVSGRLQVANENDQVGMK
jgi:hypothetical protein